MPNSRDPLGDGISSVQLIDHMGDDLFVLNRFRASAGKQSTKMPSWGPKRIQHGAAHGHWTPFAHAQLCFKFRMPIFVVREWRTHVAGLIRSEESRRDITTDPDIWLPTEWREAPDSAEKQAHVRSSNRIHPDSTHLSEAVDDLWHDELRLYQRMVEEGVAPELARTHLPQSMYVNFDETGSLYAYARICALRVSPDAQKETRLYAEAVSQLIEPLFPVSWAALRDGRDATYEAVTNG